MKYVIVKKDGMELPIVFSNEISHADIIRSQEVVAAGFLDLTAGEATYKDGTPTDPVLNAHCFGASSNGGVLSRQEEDAKIILEHFWK